MAAAKSAKDNQDKEIDFERYVCANRSEFAFYRLAREELLREGKSAQTRTETLGAVGWQACPLPPTNKRFLRNTLLGTLTRKESKEEHRNLQTREHRRGNNDDREKLKRSEPRKTRSDVYHRDSKLQSSVEYSKDYHSSRRSERSIETEKRTEKRTLSTHNNKSTKHKQFDDSRNSYQPSTKRRK